MSRPRVSLRTLAVWGFGLLALGALAVFGLASSNGRNGRPAPALPVQTLSGRHVTLATLHGRPALVVFWASWCDPCAREAPAIERFAQSLHGRATLVGVNWNDPELGNAHAFVRRYGWTFPNLRDPEGTVGLAYGVTDLPTTFLLDGSGRVREILRSQQTTETLARALSSIGA